MLSRGGAPSSRTDTGVHALRNVCHVDVERVSKRKPGEILPPHEPAVVKRAVNHFLQKNGEDVQVVDVRCVPRNFHARFEAKERTYHYRIIVSSEALSVFERNRAWHTSEQLNIPAMQQACECLVGHHDFSSFRAAGCQAKSPMKTLDELRICEMPLWLCYPSEAMQIKCCDESFRGLNEERACSSEVGNSKSHLNTAALEDALVEVPETKAQRPRCYVITARARSFLYHQVRLMVGLLKAVGTGVVQVSDVPHLLEARTVTKAPPMAPACGLYLAEVKYQLD
ncbi:hypothetical protein GOP47_0000672 [Adiantum capillus-veneris]|uniref:tRNA pseudouridine synthase n=1 Tax=Adiantum capillus-veneris TaxID=13818 RepID=A0A9D4ZQX7_ADICA|nr:hypothetical protein GOP47_0000672 [Adiantum capillus-veneris]